MPSMDGLSVIEELHRRAPAVRTVVLTSFGSESNVVRALHGGTAGFVLKNCRPDELIRAIHAAHAGEAYLSPAVTRTVLGMVTPVEPRRREAAAERLAALTARESEVLALAAEGMSNAGIGRRLHMSETTIKTYMSRILAKLGCSNRVQAAIVARDAAGR
jgi:DNA-binding NarL/FixJ family response regulator